MRLFYSQFFFFFLVIPFVIPQANTYPQCIQYSRHESMYAFVLNLPLSSPFLAFFSSSFLFLSFSGDFQTLDFPVLFVCLFVKT